MNIPLTVVLGNLPPGSNLTPQQYAQSIADRLGVSIASDSNFLFGKIGGIQPTSPLPGTGSTPGFYSPDGVTWYAWNTVSGAYLPFANVCGQLFNGKLILTTIACGATSNNTLTTPDKSGVIATMSDVPEFLGTQTLGSTTPTLDWTLKQQAYYVLPANSIMTMTGMVDGQTQIIFVEQPNDQAYTLTINGVTGWFGGTAPTFTTATSGHRKIDKIVLTCIGSGASQLVLGEIVQSTSTPAAVDIATAGGDTTPPIVSTITGNKSTITVTFNEILQGGTLTNADFTVLKNGSSDSVVSVTASGLTVVINVNNSFTAADTVTIQYTGTDIKDVAGNLAAAFGPSAVSYATVGQGGGAPGGGGQNNPLLLA